MAVVIDALAGGPVCFTPAMRAALDELDQEGLPAHGLFRAYERMVTEALVADEFPEFWAAIDSSGVDVLSVSIGAWAEEPFSYAAAIADLAEWERRFDVVERLKLIESPDDLERIRSDGGTGVLLGFQNSDQFGRDLNNVDRFYKAGVRMVQLTYNGHNDAGSGCTAHHDNGLTPFGRELLRRLQDVGIVVDVSHCGPQTTLDALHAASRPIAVSHACCSAVHPHARNKSDEVLAAIGENGGFFGVAVVPFFLRDGRASLDDVLRHLEHACRVAGPHVAGIGTDWGVVGTPAPLLRELQVSAGELGFRTEDNFDFTAQTEGFVEWGADYPQLAQLVLNDFGPATGAQILGENFVDFFSRVA